MMCYTPPSSGDFKRRQMFWNLSVWQTFYLSIKLGQQWVCVLARHAGVVMPCIHPLSRCAENLKTLLSPHSSSYLRLTDKLCSSCKWDRDFSDLYPQWSVKLRTTGDLVQCRGLQAPWQWNASISLVISHSSAGETTSIEAWQLLKGGTGTSFVIRCLNSLNSDYSLYRSYKLYFKYTYCVGDIFKT